MVNLPNRPDILSSSINTGVWKSYYGDLRDFIAQTLGGSAPVSMRVLNNTFTPTTALNPLLTEGDEAVDILETIRTTALPEGSAIFLTCGNIGQKITIKHNFGGIGSISLFQEKDIVLSSKFTIVLIREGNVWRQLNTSGYLFGEDGLISNDLITKATKSTLGIVRGSTDAEFLAGVIDTVFSSPKQVKGSIDTVNASISNLSTDVDSKILNLSNVSATKTLDNVLSSNVTAKINVDYANPTQKNVGVEYTASEDGELYIYSVSGSNRSTTVDISGVNYPVSHHGMYNNAGDPTGMSIIFRISKGVKYKINSNSSTVIARWLKYKV